MTTRAWRWIVGGCLLLVVGASARALLAEEATSDDVRFLAGLRQRRLYDLAESYCRQQLAKPELPVQRRAELVVEQARTLTEHALQSPPEGADPLWKQALDLTAGFERSHERSPWTLFTHAQGATSLLARGESARNDAELTNQPQRLTEARGYLRMAAREYTTTAERLQEHLRTLGISKRTRPGEPDRRELNSLEKHLRQQQARTSMQQARCYPAESPDRLNALNVATQLLLPLAELDEGNPLGWSSRLELVRCARLAQDLGTAQERLAALQQLEMPADIQRLAAAESLLLARAAGQLPQAVRQLQALAPADLRQTPELAVAALEIWLSSWQQELDRRPGAEESATARTYRQLAEETLEVLRAHGGWWARQGEAQLASRIAATGTNNLKALVQSAEGLYRAGRLDDALAAYDRAADQAHQERAADEEFRLRYAAAAIEHDRQRHVEAARRYRDLAVALPQHPQAPQAHLLAAFHVAQLAKENDADQAEQYARLLSDHLERWPDDATAGQAAWQLGRLEEHRQQWEAALAAYRQVPFEHEQFLSALEGALRSVEHAAAADPTLRTSCAAWLWELAATEPAGAPWPVARRQAVLAAAQLELAAARPLSDDDADVRAHRDQLQAMLEAGDGPEAPAGWPGQAQALLAAYEASVGRCDLAAQRVPRLAKGDASRLLSHLSKLAEHAPAEQQASLAPLQLATAKAAGGGKPGQDPQADRLLQRAQARSLAAAGKHREAAALLRPLAQAQPRDGLLQEELARNLVEAGDRDSLAAGKEKWQEIEKRTKQGSERWFRARYCRALCLFRLGEKDNAQQVLAATFKLYPSFGDPELKQEAEDLLRRAEHK